MPPEPATVWNDEIGKLVDFLLEHRAEGVIKTSHPSFNVVAAHIASEADLRALQDSEASQNKVGSKVSVWPSQYDRKLMACYQYTAQDNILEGLVAYKEAYIGDALG